MSMKEHFGNMCKIAENYDVAAMGGIENFLPMIAIELRDYKPMLLSMPDFQGPDHIRSMCVSAVRRIVHTQQSSWVVLAFAGQIRAMKANLDGSEGQSLVSGPGIVIMGQKRGGGHILAIYAEKGGKLSKVEEFESNDNSFMTPHDFFTYTETDAKVSDGVAPIQIATEGEVVEGEAW